MQFLNCMLPSSVWNAFITLFRFGIVADVTMGPGDHDLEL